MADRPQSGSVDFDRKSLLGNARRIVVKVGTGVVCDANQQFDPRQVAALAASIAELAAQGRQVVLVSSGAIALGADELGIHRSRLRDASVTRACAAVGQCRLMHAYAEAFRPHKLAVAQVLVTEDDFTDLKRHSILRQTFEKLLKLGAIPVVNENDTVTNIYTEQAPVFRDNDRLAALVLSKLDADALILLSNVDGLYESDGEQFDKSRIIAIVTEMTPALRGTARGGSALGRGGMTAKLDAAEIAMHAGGLVVIANGNTPAILHKIFQGEPVGTLFLPKAKMAGKRRWLAFATTVRGHVTINANARKALLDGHASLLISGVTACEGDFSSGQVIAIQDAEGAAIGRGIAECGSRDLRALLAGDVRLKGVLVRRENFLVLPALEHANAHA